MMPQLMPYDDAAWEKSEEEADSWLESLHRRDRYVAIKDFILSHRGGKPVELKPIMGGCNISFRLIYHDGSSAVLRIPVPGLSQFPDEKVQYEVAAMQWLKKNTSIPVPAVLHWGTCEQNPLQLGPFILMEFIDHETNLGTILNTTGLTDDHRAVLDPTISVGKLEFLYQQVAGILLRLSQIPLPKIGSILEKKSVNGSKEWGVNGRPLPIHWNELVRLGAFPRPELPTTTFATSSSYFNTLANLHIKHLVDQPNDAIVSESDCRQKFLARILFRKLARENSLVPPLNNTGPFRLWCDDFRPANILLDADHKITGVIDWEFTYSAPAEFAYAPPWWLLLEKPENWADGLDDWARVYEERLQCFLGALRNCEDEHIRLGELDDAQRLSVHMRESWETGRFWVTYAAMRNFAFDVVFRERLDRIFFGPGSDWERDWEGRIKLLSQEDQTELDLLVKQKLDGARFC